MDFRDFPRFPGKSGKYEIHPPKLCAGLDHGMSCGLQIRGPCSLASVQPMADAALEAALLTLGRAEASVHVAMAR